VSNILDTELAVWLQNTVKSKIVQNKDINVFCFSKHKGVSLLNERIV